MIVTSNFKISGHLPQAVAISLGVPRGWTGTTVHRPGPHQEAYQDYGPRDLH